MLKNDLVIRAAKRQRTERTPVWLMRQAGRFDPAYRALRERVDLPLEEAFRTPDLAAEISLLPRRFGVDAIIFFQDILTPLAPLGAEFVFRPGPVLESPIRTVSDVDALRPFDPSSELPYVPKTLGLVREALAGDLPLLGFAGAPLTLAFFMIEGKSPGADPKHARAMMTAEPALFRRLLDLLTDMTADYLKLQIEAGVDAIQLFESTADLVSRDEYERFALPTHVRIFEKLGDAVPRILFAKDRLDVDLMAASGADVLSVSSKVDLAAARRQYGDRVAFQGNVDNHMLAAADTTTDDISRAVRACVEAGGHEGHILNLGHGLLKNTPPENVSWLIEACRAIRLRSETTTVES